MNFAIPLAELARRQLRLARPFVDSCDSISPRIFLGSALAAALLASYFDARPPHVPRDAFDKPSVSSESMRQLDPIRITADAPLAPRLAAACDSLALIVVSLPSKFWQVYPEIPRRWHLALQAANAENLPLLPSDLKRLHNVTALTNATYLRSLPGGALHSAVTRGDISFDSSLLPEVTAAVMKLLYGEHVQYGYAQRRSVSSFTAGDWLTMFSSIAREQPDNFSAGLALALASIEPLKTHLDALLLPVPPDSALYILEGAQERMDIAFATWLSRQGPRHAYDKEHPFGEFYLSPPGTLLQFSVVVTYLTNRLELESLRAYISPSFIPPLILLPLRRVEFTFDSEDSARATCTRALCVYSEVSEWPLLNVSRKALELSSDRGLPPELTIELAASIFEYSVLTVGFQDQALVDFQEAIVRARRDRYHKMLAVDRLLQSDYLDAAARDGVRELISQGDL